MKINFLVLVSAITYSLSAMAATPAKNASYKGAPLGNNKIVNPRLPGGLPSAKGLTLICEGKGGGGPSEGRCRLENGPWMDWEKWQSLGCKPVNGRRADCP